MTSGVLLTLKWPLLFQVKSEAGTWKHRQHKVHCKYRHIHALVSRSMNKSSFVTAINAQTSAICFPLNVPWLSLSLYDFNHLLSRPLGMKLYSFSSPPFLSLFIIKVLQNILLKENWFHLSSLICPILAESLVRVLVTGSKWVFFPPVDWNKNLHHSTSTFSCIFETQCWEPQISQLLPHLLHHCTLAFWWQSL